METLSGKLLPPTDPRVLAVAEVTHRLSRANSHLKEMPADWKIAVVDDPDTINAMCLAVCILCNSIL